MNSKKKLLKIFVIVFGLATTAILSHSANLSVEEEQSRAEQGRNLFTPDLLIDRTVNNVPQEKNSLIAFLGEKGLGLQLVEGHLREDIDVVMAAVSQNGHALLYAGDPARLNKDIVMAAIRQTGDALFWAPEVFLSDEDIVSEALKTSSKIWKVLPENMKQNEKCQMAHNNYYSESENST